MTACTIGVKLRIAVVATSAVIAAAGCIGGQSEPTRQQNDALGNRSRDVPPATLLERNWTEAATGHGAAGRIPADELARLEKRSAPGGNLGGDAGPNDASSPDTGRTR
jgi:hypothetical protein